MNDKSKGNLDKEIEQLLNDSVQQKKALVRDWSKFR